MKAKLAQRPAPLARVQRQPASAATTRKSTSMGSALRVIDGGLDGSAVLRLQSIVGNQAVGELLGRPRLVVQAQAVACPPPPAPAPPILPHEDPRFVDVTERVA